MKTIVIKDKCGDFAENKDIARDYRERVIKTSLRLGEEITIDFEGVNSVTQSFIHALISDVLRENGEDILEKINFKSCNVTVKSIIGTVVSYSLE
jgi:hypothetical protein